MFTADEFIGDLTIGPSGWAFDNGTVTFVGTAPDAGNRPPIAETDQSSTTWTFPILVDLTENDSDPDGDLIEVIEETLTSNKGALVTLHANGTADYDPSAVGTNDFFQLLEPGESTTDHVFYTLVDEHGAQSVGLFEVIVTRPEVINTDQQIVSGIEGDVVTVSGTFVDPDTEVTTSIGNIEVDRDDKTWLWSFQTSDAVTFTAEVFGDNGAGNIDSVQVAVEVMESDPEILSIEAIQDPDSAEITAVVQFSDNATEDVHDVRINWGDETPSQTMEETSDANDRVEKTEGSHFYLLPGDYWITVSVADRSSSQVVTSSHAVSVVGLLPRLLTIPTSAGFQLETNDIQVPFGPDLQSVDSHIFMAGEGTGLLYTNVFDCNGTPCAPGTSTIRFPHESGTGFTEHTTRDSDGELVLVEHFTEENNIIQQSIKISPETGETVTTGYDRNGRPEQRVTKNADGDITKIETLDPKTRRVTQLEEFASTEDGLPFTRVKNLRYIYDEEGNLDFVNDLGDGFGIQRSVSITRDNGKTRYTLFNSEGKITGFFVVDENENVLESDGNWAEILSIIRTDLGSAVNRHTSTDARGWTTTVVLNADNSWDLTLTDSEGRVRNRETYAGGRCPEHQNEPCPLIGRNQSVQAPDDEISFDDELFINGSLDVTLDISIEDVDPEWDYDTVPAPSVEFDDLTSLFDLSFTAIAHPYQSNLGVIGQIDEIDWGRNVALQLPNGSVLNIPSTTLDLDVTGNGDTNTDENGTIGHRFDVHETSSWTVNPVFEVSSVGTLQIHETEIILAQSLPPLATIAPITPNPRAGAVDEIVLVFETEVPDFELGDIRLSRRTDSEVNLLLDSATLLTSDNKTWTIGNLIELTGPAGIYRLSVFGIAAETWINGAGDSNQDNRFDQFDVIFALQGNRYRTGETASWRHGDWNGDGFFDQFDLVLALQTQPRHYRQGPFAVHANSPRSAALAEDVAFSDENLQFARQLPLGD